MKLVQKYPQLGSSVDPAKLSKTIKNGSLLLIPIVISMSGMFGVTVTVADLSSVTDSLTNIVITSWAAYHAIQTLIGAIRKVLVKYRKR